MVAAGICVVLIVARCRAVSCRARRRRRAVDFARTLRLDARPLRARFLGADHAVRRAPSPPSTSGCPRCLRLSAARSAGSPPALTIVLRVARGGRFSVHLAARAIRWRHVLALLGFAIFACFAGSLARRRRRSRVYCCRVSGLFMSVLYPTLNSKGISCFPLRARRGRRRDPVLHGGRGRGRAARDGAPSATPSAARSRLRARHRIRGAALWPRARYNCLRTPRSDDSRSRTRTSASAA